MSRQSLLIIYNTHLNKIDDARLMATQNQLVTLKKWCIIVHKIMKDGINQN